MTLRLGRSGFLWIGLILLAHSVWEARSAWRFRSQGRRAQGIVRGVGGRSNTLWVDLPRSEGAPGSIPVRRVWWTLPGVYSAGDSVAILTIRRATTTP